MDMLEFGQTIKAKREQKGLTQKQLGLLLYVSEKTVSRWENNQIYPDITMLLDISKVLEIDYQELIEGSDYIEKKKAKQEQQLRRKKKGLFWFACLTFCLLLIFSYQFHEDERIEETGIDYIVSKKWNEIGRTNQTEDEHSIYSVYYFITDFQKDEIIQFLNVDQWIRIDKLPMDAKSIHYQLGFYTPSSNKNFKSQEFRTYQKDGIYYFVLFQDSNIIYQLPINPTTFTEFYKSLPEEKFTYNHNYENLSTYVSVGKQELEKLNGISDLYDPNKLISFLFIDDYFVLESSTFNIQTLDMKDGILSITGERRSYHTPYIIGLKRADAPYINKVYVNGELKFDLDQGLFNLDE